MFTSNPSNFDEKNITSVKLDVINEFISSVKAYYFNLFEDEIITLSYYDIQIAAVSADHQMLNDFPNEAKLDMLMLKYGSLVKGINEF